MMDPRVADTLFWAVMAGVSICVTGGFFVWAPWDRRRRRKPEEHPAE